MKTFKSNIDNKILYIHVGDEVTNHESVESGIIKVEPNCQSLDSEVLSTNSPGVNSHEVDRGDSKIYSIPFFCVLK